MQPEHHTVAWVRTVYGRSLHEQRRALVGWSVGVAATVLLELALFPTVRNNDMSQLLDSYPESVKKLFGLTDFSTGTGYVQRRAVLVRRPPAAHHPRGAVGLGLGRW